LFIIGFKLNKKSVHFLFFNLVGWMSLLIVVRFDRTLILWTIFLLLVLSKALFFRIGNLILYLERGHIKFPWIIGRIFFLYSFWNHLSPVDLRGCFRAFKLRIYILCILNICKRYIFRIYSSCRNIWFFRLFPEIILKLHSHSLGSMNSILLRSLWCRSI
jgi:hypothetical protein